MRHCARSARLVEVKNRTAWDRLGAALKNVLFNNAYYSEDKENIIFATRQTPKMARPYYYRP